MKFGSTNVSLRHYIRYMRKQSKHVQHIHAAAFAGVITSLIAGFILYTDYGFWHETYRKEDPVQAGEEETVGGTFRLFMQEIRTKVDSVGSTGTNLLEGKQSYTKDPQAD